MKNWLKDQYIILSGASSGIGKELTKILIDKYGANVIGIGRSEQKMLALQTELGEQSSRFSYYLFDVGKRDGWQALRDNLAQQQIAPVLLINNAGVFPPFQKLTDMQPAQVEAVLQTNFYASVYSVEQLKDTLIPSGKKLPAIVNVSSSSALCTVVGAGAYSASKAALKAYTEALAMEEKGKLHVGIIYPGTTATELFSSDENTKNSALDIVAMPARKMAKKIARKIYRRKRRAVLGWDAKLMNLTAKCMPVSGLFLIRGVMKLSHSKVFKNVFKDE